MRLAVITHVVHTEKEGNIYGYGPYVREMNLWFQHVDSVEIVAPFNEISPNPIDLPYKVENLAFKKIPEIAFINGIHILKSLVKLPIILFTIARAMYQADHIHLRCPGNIGLLGCFMQIAFPFKKKTAKYAGNWDPKARQPIFYRLQRWLLSNTFLTRNMKVFVYGEWPKQTGNVKPFFTASYFEDEKEERCTRDYNKPLKALFVGTLTDNKRAYETVQLIKDLRKAGIKITLEMYGEGPVYENIKRYRSDNSLEEAILLRGNQPSEIVKESYKNAHFIFLLSKSEGWPKAVAEAMFWGAIPIASNISCIPWMLGDGSRGILINDPENIDVETLKIILDDSAGLTTMSMEAVKWSRQYTMDTFSMEIKKML